MSGSERGAPRLGAAAAASALLALLLYANTIPNGFVFDDADVAVRNPAAQDPADLRAIFGSHYWAGVAERGNLYRPLTIASLALNRGVTGAGAPGYHAVNAGLHAGVSALVALLAGALGLTPAGALAAGLLFAAHPVHTEAVAPVVGRSELLAAFFALASWLTHLGGFRGGAAGPTAGRRAAAAVLFGAAILSKENAAVLPALILCGDLVRDRARGGWRRALVTPALLLLVLAGFLLLRAAVVPGAPPDDPRVAVFGGIDAATRIRTAVGVLGRYLLLLVAPIRLSADYSYHQIPLVESWTAPILLVSAAALLALSASGVVLAARGRLAGLAILAALGALFPVSNLALSIGTVMGERLLYLPSVGACLLPPALLAGTSLVRSRPGRAAAAAALVIVTSLFAVRTVVRNRDWRDDLTLFTATVAASPLSAKAHFNLGVALQERGDETRAVAAYRRAIAIKPDMAEAQRNLGQILVRADRAAEAIAPLAAAARLDPEMADVHSDLGIALHRAGRADEAQAAFEEEIRRRPGSSRAHYNLGSLLLERGRFAEALAELERAIALDPRDADALAQSGFALAALGRHAEAADAFEAALQRNPAMVDVLVPLARAAAAAGRIDQARRAAARAAEAGLPLPDDLRFPAR